MGWGTSSTAGWCMACFRVRPHRKDEPSISSRSLSSHRPPFPPAPPARRRPPSSLPSAATESSDSVIHSSRGLGSSKAWLSPAQPFIASPLMAPSPRDRLLGTSSHPPPKPSPSSSRPSFQDSRRPRPRAPRRSASSPATSLIAAAFGFAGASAHPFTRSAAPDPLDYPFDEPALPFLYPFLPPRTSPPAPLPTPDSRHRHSSASTSRSPPSRIHHPRSYSDSSTSASAQAGTSAWQNAALLNLPVQYTKGPDGLWRQSGPGSANETACVVSETSTSVSATTLDASADTLNATSTTSNPSPLEEFDLTDLPAGWRLQNSLPSSTLVAIITLSLALAALIAFLMICCVTWRRKRRRARDVERRIRRKAKEDVADALVASQKKWDKAGLRWMANVRASARRRRTARVLALDASHSDATLSSSSSVVSTSDSSPSLPPSLRSSSPHPTTMTISENSAPDVSSDSAPALGPAPPDPPPPPHPSVDLPPPHPSTSPPPPHPSADPHQPPAQPPAYDRAQEEASAPAPQYVRAAAPCAKRAEAHALDGHVATDDKTLLAARAALVSGPRAETDGQGHGCGSAPEAEEAEMAGLEPGPSSPHRALKDGFHAMLPPDDDFAATPLPDGFLSTSSPPLPPPSHATLWLPPPPERVAGSSKLYDEYAYARAMARGVEREVGVEMLAFEVEEEEGTSAPPFEEEDEDGDAMQDDDALVAALRPPPHRDGVLIPSAPPLQHGDALQPSAPPLFTPDDDDAPPWAESDPGPSRVDR
ncbi:hypothetical protein K488DRAFT_86140 [Vararia minispora EC-137]|uniref:Uncharacterized protein n=1 Tax=Vararia minispora EC-137 TaxID=1314806 RepID=A0ACB8QKH4_9AGAM|nr:hypothetical protein K488DRAFT_86140 [Vararia minispora EC-137]